MIAGGSLTCPLCRKYVASERTVSKYEHLLQAEWLSNLVDKGKELAPDANGALIKESLILIEKTVPIFAPKEGLDASRARKARACTILLSCACNECGKHFFSVDNPLRIHRCPECGKFNAVELGALGDKGSAKSFPSGFVDELCSGIEAVLTNLRGEANADVR